VPQLKVLGFDGLRPRMSPTLLDDNQAQVADNVKLYSGELRAWRGATKVVTTAITPLTIYKLYGSGAPIWLSWATDVDVVRGPLADDDESRIYLTGDPGHAGPGPQKTNYAGAAANTFYPMGVPAPTVKPNVAAAGGSGTAESRAYVYTYVVTFGAVLEESAPSPPSSTISVLPGGTVTVNGFTVPPVGWNVTHRRIYRTVTGQTTDSYEFVTEIPLATTTFADNLTVAQLGEALSTIGWTPPPDDLKGLISVAGGFLAGFVGNTIYFSEPFYPHAWPIRYAISIPEAVIGLAAYGSSIAVMTDGFPYILNGSGPGYLSAEKLPMLEPCVSKTSITSDEQGVIYASPNGLIAIGSGMRGNMTRDLYTRDEWAEVNPAIMRGAMYAGKYFGIFPALSDGRALVMNRDDRPALSNLDLNATAVHIDARESNLYFAGATDGDIYLVDADEVHPISYQWRSKRYRLPTSTSWSACTVDADFDQALNEDVYNAQVAAVAAANSIAWGQPLRGALNETMSNTFDLNGSTLLNVPSLASARSVQLLLYNEGHLEATLDVRSMSPFRLPAFKGRVFEFELAGNIDVRSIIFGTTVQELYT